MPFPRAFSVAALISKRALSSITLHRTKPNRVLSASTDPLSLAVASAHLHLHQHVFENDAYY